MTTQATLFSGGEGVGVGARAAGIQHLWGVEIDPDIAAVAEQNGFKSIVADVRNIDPHTLERPDILHASPVCKNASVANSSADLNEDGTKESKIDIETAEATANFIRVLKPDVFTLENVYPYRKFKAFAIICAALHDVGYFYDYDNINAADFGVPQTRRRLFLRASRVGLVPQLPAPEPWVGWYEAIEDLIDTLPESQFAEWQLARLPQGISETSFVSRMEQVSTVTSSDFGRPVSMPKAFLINNQHSQPGGAGAPQMAGVDDPAMPITATIGGRVKAFIINGRERHDYAERNDVTLREGEQPIYTLSATSSPNRHKAFIVDGKPANYNGDLQITPGDSPAVTVTSSQPRHPFRAWLAAGRVVKMTTRALARFQSFPDSYELPAKDSLACKVIGNAVCPLLYQKLIREMI